MQLSSLIIPDMDLHDNRQLPVTNTYFILSTPDNHLIQGPKGIIFAKIPSILNKYVSTYFSIGHFEDEDWNVSVIDSSVLLPNGYSQKEIKGLYGNVPDKILGIACRAVQLARFDYQTRYCGYCGEKNIVKNDEIAKVCSSCKRIVFPRLSPAVIVRITDGDKILLSRSPNFNKGMYSIQAGFVEPGESLESAVKREVKEEIGVNIKNLKYIASQPWPFPDSLMIGFTADYESGEIKPDGTEIEDARWFTIDTLPNLPSTISISRFMIQNWIDHMSKK